MNLSQRSKLDHLAGAEAVGPSGPVVLGASPSTPGAMLREMIWEMVRYRELLLQMTIRDLQVRYKQAIMGFGWAILMPSLIIAAGLLIRRIALQSNDVLGVSSVAGITVKALAWAFFSGAIGSATTSLSSNHNLVTKIYFPREVFPLSAVLTQCIDTLIGVATLVPLMLFFLGTGISVQSLWALPVVLLLVALTAGAALFLSSANLFFRDVKYLVQLVVSFGIFFTPVLYDAPRLGPLGSRLVMLNPLTPLIEGLRLSVVEHHNLLVPLVVTTAEGLPVTAWQPWYLAYATAWSIGGLLLSWVAFHRNEFLYAEYI